MTENKFQFDREEIINFLLDNVISTKARLIAIEYAFYAYVELNNPGFSDKLEVEIAHEEKKQFLKLLDDLAVLDQVVSDRLRNELNNLWDKK